MSVKLTESQQIIVSAIVEVIGEVRAEVIAEIRQLRQEQSARHKAGESLADTVPHIVVKREGASLDMDAALNRWQGLAQSAQGNISRITKEIQEYLREGVFPTKKQ